MAILTSCLSILTVHEDASRRSDTGLSLIEYDAQELSVPHPCRVLTLDKSCRSPVALSRENITQRSKIVYHWSSVCDYVI